MLLYLDCDTGIDDALAIALLLGNPGVTIAGIGTVDGNTSAVQAAANTSGLLALAGRNDIPVAVGGAGALGAGASGAGAAHVHGGNGVGGVRLPSGSRPDSRTPSEMLADLARQYPGELHVLATGPCTNLARAMTADPRLSSLIASVTVMGGAVRVPGNVTGRAEANIAGDPVAAAEVFAAPWPVTLVPLDVSMTQRWSETERAALAGGSPLCRALAAMLPAYFDFYEPVLGVREVPLHDPLAAAIAVGDLEPASAPLLGLRVEPGDGSVVEDEEAAGRVRVVFSVERPAGPLILERILRD